MAVLIAIVSFVFFTKDGRAGFEQFCDGLDDRLVAFGNLRQRCREFSRRNWIGMRQRRAAWEWAGRRRDWE